jgi:hypothetical protein
MYLVHIVLLDGGDAFSIKLNRFRIDSISDAIRLLERLILDNNVLKALPGRHEEVDFD